MTVQHLDRRRNTLSTAPDFERQDPKTLPTENLNQEGHAVRISKTDPKTAMSSSKRSRFVAQSQGAEMSPPSSWSRQAVPRGRRLWQSEPATTSDKRRRWPKRPWRKEISVQEDFGLLLDHTWTEAEGEERRSAMRRRVAASWVHHLEERTGREYTRRDSKPHQRVGMLTRRTHSHVPRAPAAKLNIPM